MLGVQDFCGYYDWTFNHFRRHFGEAALREMLADAIGLDAQQHYLASGQSAGLRGLFDVWTATGEDEKCDWTFTLAEPSNVLRWDMRKCPSKGFLLQNDFHADEDYCDHCIGWVKSMLSPLGMEMVHHEHNHCGQCWGEIRVKGKPYTSLELDCDIRKDPRWNGGHIDRFVDQEKASARPELSSSPATEQLLLAWLDGRELVVVDELGAVFENDLRTSILSATHYAQSRARRCVVLIESPPVEAVLHALSAKLTSLGPSEQPLLLYPYLPQFVAIRFAAIPLPRPLTVMPMLIHAGAYLHEPNAAPPPTLEWMLRIAATVSGAAAR